MSCAVTLIRSWLFSRRGQLGVQSLLEEEFRMGQYILHSMPGKLIDLGTMRYCRFMSSLALKGCHIMHGSNT
jgi:hypothetical protein